MDTDGPTDVRRTFKNFYFLEVEGNFWDTFLKAEQVQATVNWDWWTLNIPLKFVTVRFAHRIL